MDYENTLYMIRETKRLHRTAVKDLAKVLKDFAQHGWHDEDLAEDYYMREYTLYSAINSLFGRLVLLASMEAA